MRRYAIIPTRLTPEEYTDNTTEAGKLKEYFEEAGWSVHFMENEESIFKAYENGVAECNVQEEDFVILCHDDIEVLLQQNLFNELLEHLLPMDQIGFVGVAGSAHIEKENPHWFHSARRQGSGGGLIFHGKSITNMMASVYGTAQETVILDGVFLATTGKVLNQISLKKPSTFVSNWHWYDALLTFQAHRKGFLNVVAPLLLRHQSGGSYDADFKTDTKNFAQLFSKELPASLPKA